MKHIDLMIGNYPALKNIKTDIENATKMLIKSFEASGKLLLCGNGGSAADCEHISGELMKGFLLKRELTENDKTIFGDFSDKLQYGLPCIPLTSFSSLTTAVSNDTSADMIFAQSVMALGQKNDTLLAMSTSGNSKNIVFAAKTAKAKGLCVISITGKNDSELSAVSDITIKIPETKTYLVQELTLPVYHSICAEIENYFYG